MSNGPIALPTNTSEANRGFRLKRPGFITLVTGAMAALALKERWDAYRKVPDSAENGNLSPPPPSYHDDSDTESAIGLETNGLDTEIPNVSRRSKRSKGCCMCCGLNCSLFCKAIGIAILIIVVWNTISFVRWWMTPSPTGLENMPEYSKSLGCLDATNYYLDQEFTYQTVPLKNNGHVFEIDGGAYGTLVIAPAEVGQSDSEVKVKASIRTSNKALLDAVSVTGVQGKYSLSTIRNANGAAGCMRFDLTVHIPAGLTTLNITASSVTQVKFSDAFQSAPQTIEALVVSLSSPAATSMFLPSADLRAAGFNVDMRGGYLVGAMAGLKAGQVNTYRGDAITNLKVVASTFEPAELSRLIPLYFGTVSGTGRTDIVMENPDERQLSTDHTSRGAGDMYLTYSNAHFNGPVDLQARSYTAFGLQGTMMGPDGTKGKPWAGKKDGHDSLKVVTQGWARLNF